MTSWLKDTPLPYASKVLWFFIIFVLETNQR